MRRDLHAAMRTLVLMTAGAALMLPLPGAAAKVTSSRSGKKIQTTTKADWLHHPNDDSYYTESWTAVLATKGGDVFYLNFVYSNIGVLSGQSAVNVVHVRPGKASKHYRWNYDEDDLKVNPATSKIVIGPNWLVCRGREFQIHIKEKGFSLHLDATAWTDGVKFHDGKVFLSDDKKEWMQTLFHMPRGDARGTLDAGGTKIDLAGAIYLDHLMQNILGTDYSERWWVFRMFTDTHTLDFIAFRAAPDRGGKMVVRMILTDRNEVLAFSDKMRLTTGGKKKDPKGHRYESRYSFKYKDDTLSLEGACSSKRLQDREAFMENLSWLERKVAEMVAGNPINYRMETNAEVTITMASGETVTMTGPAHIETIVMQGEPDKD